MIANQALTSKPWSLGIQVSPLKLLTLICMFYMLKKIKLVYSTYVQYAWHIFSNIWSSNVNSVFFFHITFPPKSHLFEIISSDQEARISVICHIFFLLTIWSATVIRIEYLHYGRSENEKPTKIHLSFGTCDRRYKTTTNVVFTIQAVVGREADNWPKLLLTRRRWDKATCLQFENHYKKGRQPSVLPGERILNQALKLWI